jgi:hypothetical protein
MMLSVGNSGLYGQVSTQRLLGGLMQPHSLGRGQIPPTGERVPVRLADLPRPDALPRLIATPRRSPPR